MMLWEFLMKSVTAHISRTEIIDLISVFEA
jgi:hypothetical protein